jgi:hypothetical protein
MEEMIAMDGRKIKNLTASESATVENPGTQCRGEVGAER